MNTASGRPRKVVVVGAGSVGSTFCYALAQSGVADTIVVVDMNRELARGQVLDLAHGLPYYQPVSIAPGGPDDYRDADIIVITAGARQREGETRLDLLKKNAAIIERIMGDIVSRDSAAVVIMVSNPVDVLTRLALRHSGWDRRRIIGSGTVLDSARFRYLTSLHCGVDTRNVHAYVLGEHGDSEFAAWSMAHIGGLPIPRYCKLCRKCEGWEKHRENIQRQVRDSAYHIINYKGATNFGIGMALVRIVTAIIRAERSVLTVSTMLEGEYGLEDVCLSVPCLVSRNGVEMIIDARLEDDEARSLRACADIVRKAAESLQSAPGSASGPGG